jgi:UV DNA damage repair endonuclease
MGSTRSGVGRDIGVNGTRKSYGEGKISYPALMTARMLLENDDKSVTSKQVNLYGGKKSI